MDTNPAHPMKPTNKPKAGKAERPLFIPLKTEYFNAFKSRKKEFEYRPLGPRWNHNTCRIGRRVVLSKGYGKYSRLNGLIHGTYTIGDPRSIPGWVECYGHELRTCIAIAIVITK